MTRKYIVVNKLGEHIIIFSAGLTHAEVAGNMDVISAGFIDISYNHRPSYDRHLPGSIVSEAICYGKSTTLNIESRPKYDSILAKILLKESY